MTLLLTVTQAAHHLQICPEAIYEMVEQRKIRHLRIGPRQRTIRFRIQDLEAYAESCIVEPRGTIVSRQSGHLARPDLKSVIQRIKETT